MKSNRNKNIRKENALHRPPTTNSKKAAAAPPPPISPELEGTLKYNSKMLKTLVVAIGVLVVTLVLVSLSAIPRFAHAEVVTTEQVATTEGKVEAALQEMDKPVTLSDSELTYVTPLERIVTEVSSSPQPPFVVGHISTGLVGVDIHFEGLSFKEVNLELKSVVDCLEQKQSKYLPAMEECVGVRDGSVDIYKYGVFDRMKNYFQ